MTQIKKLNEIKPLSNFDIEHIMKYYMDKKLFLGVFDQDSLPKIDHRPTSLILNTMTDKSNKIGHWVSIVIDKRGKGHYFDSYGKPPIYKSWKRFLTQNSQRGVWVFNKRQVQDYNTNSCGYFAIDFIVKRLKYSDTISDLSIIKHMNERSVFKNYNMFIK